MSLHGAASSASGAPAAGGGESINLTPAVDGDQELTFAVSGASSQTPASPAESLLGSSIGNSSPHTSTQGAKSPASPKAGSGLRIDGESVAGSCYSGDSSPVRAEQGVAGMPDSLHRAASSSGSDVVASSEGFDQPSPSKRRRRSEQETNEEFIARGALESPPPLNVPTLQAAASPVSSPAAASPEDSRPDGASLGPTGSWDTGIPPGAAVELPPPVAAPVAVIPSITCSTAASPEASPPASMQAAELSPPSTEAAEDVSPAPDLSCTAAPVASDAAARLPATPWQAQALGTCTSPEADAPADTAAQRGSPAVSEALAPEWVASHTASPSLSGERCVLGLRLPNFLNTLFRLGCQ